ncbi:MAG: DNA repair protein RecO [Candidatus Muproteobacteria bacterium RBG_19FT_COMBO_61_10]|uniref:DNA repair protein RecO n=1 Tax=Candidatus Muproteobacteria bacterium RBG_19FT_COMBO_61_10 TaxID=1817761 RepID=A0A1F6UKV3_9PROT|nr:MAG: DNA repair protein RecO [Candidatus Muproteobacteria bacterium RBG_19FT_COMBO_61_10]
MRVNQEPACVLHHHDYGETSLLLEMFTRRHGRLGVVAKGARRAHSPLRFTLIPFQPLVIGFSGRGELPTLTAAEPAGAAPAIAGEALFCGLYLNELLLRLLHRHDPHERLFESYSEALGRLGEGRDREAALRVFEKRLLEDIGFGLVLDHDVQDGVPLQPGQFYRYLPERGPVPAHAADGEGIAVQGASLLALAREQLVDGAVLHEVKHLMRALLARHLGERPLTSRGLFRRRSVRNALEYPQTMTDAERSKL